MISKINARDVALKIINEVENAGAYANLALSKELGRQRLPDQDRRFVTELVYGTIKAGKTLDWMLSQYSARPLEQITPVILNILKMGLYQLFFLSKVPPSAACNEAVELAKKYGHSGTVKFVNGILRAATRQPEKGQYPDKELLPVEYLSLKYFHPMWLVKRWYERLGSEECEALCMANNQTPPLCLRTNTLKITRTELMKRLEGEGVTCEVSKWAPEGIICHEFPALNTLNTLREGLFQVQDESSMLVAHVVDPQPGELVLDTCSAPGGKSTHLAALMGNQGRIISGDIYAHKLKLVEENAERLGITMIETKEIDAINIDTHYEAMADRVLVDAPCSGLGVLRRRADSRWRKTAEQLAELPLLQTQILTSAARCVKPQGVLIYSTCTTEPEENEQVIKQFLQKHPEFKLQVTGAYLPKPTAETVVQLWPQRDGVDGFFIARMIKE